jgi:hypothetical protein
MIIYGEITPAVKKIILEEEMEENNECLTQIKRYITCGTLQLYGSRLATIKSAIKAAETKEDYDAINTFNRMKV